MASEKFSNLAETTLASGYTSGTTTLSVTSAAGFPTVGVFRVRLGNVGKTIWRVDSVSGTTFTGAAEANDANANSGDTVVIVASRAVAERFLQTPTAAEVQAYGGVAGVDRYGPMWKLTPLDQSSWLWINQGTASISQASGVVNLTLPSDATDNIRGRVVSAPSTPYKFTALVIPAKMFFTNFCIMGIGLRESVTSKVIQLAFRTAASGVQIINVRKWTNNTTFSSEVSVATFVMLGQFIFLRIGDNGTNVTFEYSQDGVNFFTALSETRGTFFTTAPDQVGIVAQNLGTTVDIGMSYLGWTQS